MKDWKLKLRYGQLTTPFQHFTVIGDGLVGQLEQGFECRPGKAYMGMKTWATDAGEAAEMIQEIGTHIGFTVTGKIQVFKTEPMEPPGDNPRGYDIQFTPYHEK